MKRQFVFKLDPSKLDNRRLLLNETLFHNANGYIGIRYVLEEGYPEGYQSIPGQYINGFYDFSEVDQAEGLFGLAKEKQTMLNVADMQSIRIFLEKEEFGIFQGTVIEGRLVLDMTAGTTIREVLWRSPTGKELRISVTRMASFHQLPLFTIEYTIEPLNFSGEMSIESKHGSNVSNYVDPSDPRMADGVTHYLTPVLCQVQNGISCITSKTSRSNLEITSCVKNVLSQESQTEFLFENCQTICRMHTRASQNVKISLVKYAVFCDSIRYKNSRGQAIKEMKKALTTPLEVLYDKQKEYLDNYWKNCEVTIENDEESHIATQFGLYQLLQSVGKDLYSNVAPKGLSGEGYEGHFFWDTEMYIQPFFTITNPEISKRLIEYRYTTLPWAKENAKIMGHKRGALYPWRTIMGKECSGYFPAGSAQYHINGAIAYSIILYYLATKDLYFIREKGAEIMFETARLWLDVGHYYKGKFHINNVTGPDEYTCIVNNNYYTNVLARYHLNWVVKFYNLLKDKGETPPSIQNSGITPDEILEFEKAADNMYLPYDEVLKINPQDDSFLQKSVLSPESIPPEKYPLFLHFHPLHLYRHQICKQPDTIMAHFLLEDAQSEETMRNSYQYYEKITTHDSSLSSPIFSIMASRLDMHKKAFEYFQKSVNIDLGDLYHNTKDGLHIASMGGNFMSIVYGFGGFRLKENGIFFSPVLPEKWTNYRFEVVYEGSRINICVRKEQCVFILESGSPKNIFVYGNQYLLNGTLLIKCPSHINGGPK